MRQRLAQHTQPERLAGDIRMQRDAHDQRLFARLFEHLVELVDDAHRELPVVDMVGRDRRDVVDLLRIRHRQDSPAAARRHPGRLVVVTPVQMIGKPRLGQQIGGDVALCDPRPEPALRRLTEGLGQTRTGLVDQRRFAGFVEFVLRLTVGAPVRDQLRGQSRPIRGDQFRAVIDDAAVHDQTDRQPERFEHRKHPPCANPVAVFAPGIVEYVGLAATVGERRAVAATEIEMLEIQADVHRQTAALRPVEVRAIGDRAVIEAGMRHRSSRHDVEPLKAALHSSARNAHWMRTPRLR